MAEDRVDTSRLRELLAGLTEDLLTPAEESELNGLLNASDAARAFYRRHMTMDALLWWEYTLPSEPVPPKVSAPALGFFGNAVHATTYGFSQGWPMAYLVALTVLSVGLVIGSLVSVSRSVHVVRDSSLAAPLDPPMSIDRRVRVGRITGMVDCQWDDHFTAAFDGALVPLDGKYVLSSGLMEITYNTGARVILQGPATYEVESPNGGFLSVGKLTARLEKSEVRGQGAGSANHQSEINDQKFVVRTPTATVTDLGTEFGVEVGKDGNTTSHVYRGSVRLQASSSDETGEVAARVLHANESARVEHRGSRGGDNRITMLSSSARPLDFVRAIPKQTIKTLDLADVVAGGDGFSNRRNRGIDPRNGRAVDGETKEHPLLGDGKYHRVAGMPLVDGVFIPYGASGPVQLDSFGHTFAEFSATENKTGGLVFAGKEGDNSSELGGVEYNSPAHGMIAMHANKGVTFDLDAIRRANPGWRLLRFRGVAGNAEIASERGLSVYADVWVFVDGQVRFRRREINRYNGPIPVVVPITDNERFLTLVATDGANGIGDDHTMFGDPQIEMAPVDAPGHTTSRGRTSGQ